MKKQTKFPAINFEINVDGTPVEVTAKPYLAANDQQRFRVSYNGSPVHIFGLDESSHEVKVLDSATAYIPHNIEAAISNTLLHKMAA